MKSLHKLPWEEKITKEDALARHFEIRTLISDLEASSRSEGEISAMKASYLALTEIN